jgi:hypothetical protein
MKEGQWLSCQEPQLMLEYLGSKGSDRKFRLFACACCRRQEKLLRSEQVRQAIATVEQYADRRINLQSLWNAIRPVETVLEAIGDGIRPSVGMEWVVIQAVKDAMNDDGYSAAKQVAEMIVTVTDNKQEVKEERASHCHLLREIFGNPCHLVTVDPAWLIWNDGTVPKLAQGIYDERAFDRMPILADALEEAGCTNAVILAHCRQPSEHVLGCWVVDLMLGKT